MGRLKGLITDGVNQEWVCSDSGCNCLSRLASGVAMAAGERHRLRRAQGQRHPS